MIALLATVSSKRFAASLDANKLLSNENARAFWALDFLDIFHKITSIQTIHNITMPQYIRNQSNKCSNLTKISSISKSPKLPNQIQIENPSLQFIFHNPNYPPTISYNLREMQINKTLYQNYSLVRGKSSSNMLKFLPQNTPKSAPNRPKTAQKSCTNMMKLQEISMETSVWWWIWCLMMMGDEDLELGWEKMEKLEKKVKKFVWKLTWPWRKSLLKWFSPAAKIIPPRRDLLFADGENSHAGGERMIFFFFYTCKTNK